MLARMNTAAAIAEATAPLVGDNIRQRRIALGLSQAALTQRVRIPIAQSNLSQYETGRVLPTLPMLLVLAEALGCKVEDLTEGC